MSKPNKIMQLNKIRICHLRYPDPENKISNMWLSSVTFDTSIYSNKRSPRKRNDAKIGVYFEAKWSLLSPK